MKNKKNTKEVKKGAENKYYLMYVLKELAHDKFSTMQYYGIAMFEQLALKEAIKILKKEKTYKEIIINKGFSFSYIDARKKLMKEKEMSELIFVKEKLLAPHKEITSEEFYKLKALTDELQNCQLIISKEFFRKKQVFLLQFKGEYSYSNKEILSPYIQI